MVHTSFIQSWYCAGFSDQQWENELSQMKDVGINNLILADIFGKSKKSKGGKWQFYFEKDINKTVSSLYGDEIDGNMLKRAMDAAKKYGIKIYLGTGSYDDWWKFGPKTKDMTEFYKTCAKIMDGIHEKYGTKYFSQIAGWYFSPEISNSHSFGYSKHLVQSLNIIIDKINQLTPNLPLMLSPYYTKYLSCSMKKMQKTWCKILNEVNFRPYDILAPQDAIGAGWIDFDDFDDVMQMYTSAIKQTSKSIKFWINCENFIQPHKGTVFFPKKTMFTNFLPAPIDRFARQIEMAKKYTNDIITFSYNHYYSPNVTHRAFFEAYRYYVKNQSIPKNELYMLDVTYTKEGKKTLLTINNPKNNFVCATIYRNGKQFKRYDAKFKKDTLLTNTFNCDSTGKYWIETQDGFGNTYSSNKILVK